MKYPKYNKNDLHFAIQDGDTEISGFASFLDELSNREMIDHDAEKGILAFVRTNGTENLSPKQSKVLEIIVSRYYPKECSRCGNDLTWEEVIEAEENGSYCSYCAYQIDKIED